MTNKDRMAGSRVLPLLLGGTLLIPLAQADDASGKPRRQDAAPAGAPAAAAPKPAPAADPNDPRLAGHFSGRVIGPGGKPVARARIHITPDRDRSEGPGPVRAVTDADGRFAFDAPDMTCTELDGLPARRQGLLIAAADGFAPDWTITWGQNHSSSRSHWDPVEGAELTLRLVPDDRTIHGRFLDPDGRPLAGARVRLVSLMVPWNFDLDEHLAREVRMGPVSMTDYARQLSRPHVLPGVQTDAVTDADGRFTLMGLGRERLARLEVSAPSVVDTELTVMTRDAPDVGTRRGEGGQSTQTIHGAGFTLRLDPGRTITGVVRDRDTHEPVPDMWVGLRGDPLRGLTEGDYPHATDSLGRFTITGVHPANAQEEFMAVPKPGSVHVMASARPDEKGNVVIECPRGIPFRLKLLDEEGRRVEADVTYVDINPNPHAPQPRFYDARWPIDRAVRRPIGTYEGFVLPGPGAILVKTPGRPDFRPAHVNPKAFFAPGKTDWTPQEKVSDYGTDDIINVHAGWWADQNEYAAIVLVNPPVGSQPLELSARIERDHPHRIAIVDPQGQPVVGVHTDGLTYHPWDAERPLRTASFPLTDLRPGRFRRIHLVHPGRKLVGFLLVRGGEEPPATVRLQPWATVTGRILNEDARSTMPATLSMGDFAHNPSDDPNLGEHRGVPTDATGRFRIEGLMPGQRYTAIVYRGIGQPARLAFENVVLGPGETRDLGDIRPRPLTDGTPAR